MKLAIDTWDFFDTLVARFIVDSRQVFPLVEEKTGVSGFVQVRQQAQRMLDERRQPYTLHQIYQCMEEHLGVSAELSRKLIAAEIVIEMDQLVPIRRQIDRVASDDLIVSDMYLSADQIQDIMRRICGMHINRPPVVGNWGKAQGSIWAHLTAEYLVRCHHGDNPHSDHVTPAWLAIPTELIGDARLTDWEQGIANAGQFHLACLGREVRLRTLPLRAESFHASVVGPYMTFLMCAALYLRQLAHENPRRKLIFVSRDCCHVSHVFRAMCPEVESIQLDLTRRLLSSGETDALFTNYLDPDCLIVDIVASGTSLGRFSQRTGLDRRALFFIYFDMMLTQAGREDRAKRVRDDRLVVMFQHGDLAGNHLNLEMLLDPGHATVVGLRRDDVSGALIKTFGPADSTAVECELTEFVNRCVSELGTSVARRGYPNFTPPQELTRLLKMSLDAIGVEKGWLSKFPTFMAREDRGGS